MDQWFASLRRGVWGNTLLLYGFYVNLATFEINHRFLQNISSSILWPIHQKGSWLGSTFNQVQRKSWTCSSKECVSTAKNTVWQTRLVQYPLHRQSKAFQKNGNILFWINLCARGQIHDSDKTTWIGNRVAIFISVSSNWFKKPILYAIPIQANWSSHLLMLSMS